MRKVTTILRSSPLPKSMGTSWLDGTMRLPSTMIDSASAQTKRTVRGR
jgi:hypothetical protein